MTLLQLHDLPEEHQAAILAYTADIVMSSEFKQYFEREEAVLQGSESDGQLHATAGRKLTESQKVSNRLAQRRFRDKQKVIQAMGCAATRNKAAPAVLPCVHVETDRSEQARLQR